VVDPPGVVPTFVALTKDEQPSRRRAILTRAVLIAFGVAIFFLLAGRAVLSYLGVTVQPSRSVAECCSFWQPCRCFLVSAAGSRRPNQRNAAQSGKTFLSFRWQFRSFRGPALLPLFFCSPHKPPEIRAGCWRQ